MGVDRIVVRASTVPARHATMRQMPAPRQADDYLSCRSPQVSSNLKRLEFVGLPFASSFTSRSKMRPNLFPYRRGREPQNPDAVPFKVQMPLALRNRVTGKGSKLEEKGCLYEISLVLSCLQQNNYENKFCTKEVTAFHDCYRNYEVNRTKSKEQARKGILTPNTKNLQYNQLNILLKKFPQC